MTTSENNELEKTLWSAADKLRNNMDAAEYKHIVLGLIFLKYISDDFNNLYLKLKEGKGKFEGADLGEWIDEAMDSIEKINPMLKGTLPKIYADSELNKQHLGELINLIDAIGFNRNIHKSKDILGRVYEYFLGQFAVAEGKKGGQFYTPACIVKLLVEMLEPYQGLVYDGCCGSGGMFIRSEKFIEEHGGRIDDISIFGQESNPAILRLARMNLAIHGIDAKIELGDTFLNDQHQDLDRRVDFILANPPFNSSDWAGEQLRDDQRWEYGVPPVGNANYAWLQHFASKLNHSGTAGIVLANESMDSNSGGEEEIRKKMIEAGLIDCMVALPSQLFYHTMLPACLWFLAWNKINGKFRNRSNKILFIDARKLGSMINRRNKELTDEDIAVITGAYHNWRNNDGNYEDKPGFCKSATIDEVRVNNYALMPGRYVGTEEEADDGVPFEEKMNALTAKLAEQFTKGAELEKKIKENLEEIGYGSSF
jgi:type I restriction enzyme M protein